MWSEYADNPAAGFYPEITYQDLIREEVAPEFRALSDEEIDLMLGEVLSGMSPEEIEGFWGSLKRFARRAGRTLVRAAPKILPVAGGALGTLFGGPLGTAIGTKLGGLAGGLVRSAGRPPARPRAAPGGRSAVPAGGSNAAAQLMALLGNPALLQSLLGQLMGGRGRVEVVADGEAVEVPFGAFMNALEQLAAEAALEAHESGVAEAGVPEYVLDEEGLPMEDAGLPEVRARMLLELLQAAESEERWQEPARTPEDWLLEAGLVESRP